MKVSDYIAKFLAVNGVKHIFGVQGGAVVHLFDSAERLGQIETIYCHHEQAAALAATSNAKVTEGLGAAIVTTGPGATNALTGLLAAWQDSVPVFFISGQTRIEHTSYGKNVRQVGSQEFNILDIVGPMTTYCKMLADPEDVVDVLAEAFYHAFEGRGGPVWIDIPVNLQWEEQDFPEPEALTPPRLPMQVNEFVQDEFLLLRKLLESSEKPLFIAGNGIRASGTTASFLNLVQSNQIPYVSSWTAADITGSDDPLYAGIIGVCGQRGANKVIYEADLIVCLGSHLSIPQTSTLFAEFAPKAKKAIVDIDKGELDNLNIAFDLKIHADLRTFFDSETAANVSINSSKDWLGKVQQLKKLNSVEKTLNEKSSLGDESHINSNYFNARLTEKIPATSQIVIDGGGTALYTGFQSSVLKPGQRMICSSAISAMGTGLPESIGVSLGLNRAEVYCLIGDGSLMFNIHELQTIAHNKLPVKIIVFNNKGYLAIRHTQKSFLEGRYFGTDPRHGISVPDISGIAKCFGIDFIRAESVQEVDDIISKVISKPGSMIVEVCVSPEQAMLFQQGYKEIAPKRFQPANLSEMVPYI